MLFRSQTEMLNFFVLTDRLIPESMPLEMSQGCPDVSPIPWDMWAPAALHPATMGYLNTDRVIGIAGLHVIYEEVILDFNQYDAAHDIYGPRTTTGNHGTSTHCTDDRSIIHAGPAYAWLPPGHPPSYRYANFHVPTEMRTQGPLYREIPFSGIQVQDDEAVTLHFIEEEDGPKVCAV